MNRMTGRRTTQVEETRRGPKNPLLNYEDLAKIVIGRCMGNRVEGDEGALDEEEARKARTDDKVLEGLVVKLVREKWGKLDPSCFPDSDNEEVDAGKVTLWATSKGNAKKTVGKARQGETSSGGREEASKGAGKAPKGSGKASKGAGAPEKLPSVLEESEGAKGPEGTPETCEAEAEAGRVADVAIVCGQCGQPTKSQKSRRNRKSKK